MTRNPAGYDKYAPPMIYLERPRLIVLEGIDLSGRTTQVQLLLDWLIAQRYHVMATSWRTSPLISDLLARARAGGSLRPLSYSMLYAADHIDRVQYVIRPALAHGEIVLADRYLYTALARDTARSLNPTWVQNLYSHSVLPDAVFYLHISPEEAVQRRLSLQQQRLGGLHLGKHSTARGEKDGKDGKEQKQRKTEMLYHRPRFGEFLQARQQGASDGVGDISSFVPATTAGSTTDSGESRTKGKKSKGKK